MSDLATSFVTALPFVRHVGIACDGAGALVLAQEEHHGNHVGTLHAGALFTLGESASGAAIVRDLAPALGGALPVAKDASIAYRKPARGRIVARGALAEGVDAIAARLAKDGKASFEVAVTMTDDAGVEVATMRVTWYVRAPAKEG
jgi:acyl-coenzyme A thioesterase PaaI-like protein